MKDRRIGKKYCETFDRMKDFYSNDGTNCPRYYTRYQSMISLYPKDANNGTGTDIICIRTKVVEMLSFNYDDRKPISLASCNPWFLFSAWRKKRTNYFGWTFFFHLTRNAIQANKQLLDWEMDERLHEDNFSWRVLSDKCTVYTCRTLDREKIR